MGPAAPAVGGGWGRQEGMLMAHLEAGLVAVAG